MAFPQELGSGVRLLFDIGTSVRISDNDDLDPVSAGTTVRSDTDFTFGLESETRTQSLSLSTGFTLRAEDGPSGSGLDAEDPRLRFDFSRTGANAGLTLSAAFDRSDVSGFSALDEGGTFGSTDLISDDGKRDTFRFGAELEIGTTAPLGFEFDVERRGTRFRDTTDVRLFDSTTDTASAAAVLRLSPVTEGRITLDLIRYEADNLAATMRDTAVLTFGVDHAFSQTARMSASVGARRIDDSGSGVSEGAEAALSYTLDLPRGSASVSLSSELSTAGRRNELELARRFEFPDWSIAFEVGVVDFEGTDAQLVGDVTYSRTLKRGEVTASLSRDVSVDNNAAVQQTTEAEFGYSHMVNSVSDVAFNLSYTDIDDAGGGGVTGRERGSLSVVYQRELARDWELSAGYERRFLSSAGGGDAWDNAVFVSINRQFSGLAPW